MDDRARRIAQVYILRTARSLVEPFDYLIPPAIQPEVVPGRFVRVPFGKSETLGLVAGIKEESEYGELKEVIEVIEKGPSLPDYAVRLAKWMADYYVQSFYSCLSLYLPENFQGKLVKLVKFIDSSAPDELTDYLLQHSGSAPYRAVEAAFGRKRAAELVADARERGAVAVYWVVPRPGVRARKAVDIHIADRQAFEAARRRTRSKSVLAFLNELEQRGIVSYDEAKETFGLSLARIKKLAGIGAVYIEERFVSRASHQGVDVSDAEVVLTDAQRKALEAINLAVEKHSSEEFLLFGVTGSGKTEVYLRAAQKALSLGYEVIYLVPEISLTPQTVTRIERFFGRGVAVFHSGMTRAQRLDEWVLVQQGLKKVAVGPRSALFLPFKNPGLIIVDEEHEDSYKQDSPPYYDARTAARQLAAITGAVVVYGSATPSVERMYEAKAGRINLFELPERLSGSPPAVELVDMKKEKHPLSQRLASEIVSTLKRGEKVLLFLNRRGYAVVETCRDCGYVAECRFCSVSLRYHRDEKKLVCHYCGYSRPVDAACPECGGERIRLQGTGTQKLEEEISSLVSSADARVVRLDSDVARREGVRGKLLDFLSEGSAVLVGTQMIARGLHIPEVTLVGVVNADVGLMLPDFRAEERTYQLISQVIGRAGRGEKPGRVIVQTRDPDRAVIQAAVTGDYRSFYRSEIDMRRLYHYPPFYRLVRILVHSPKEDRAVSVAEELKDGISQNQALAGVEMRGPVPAPFYRLRGRYRLHIILKFSPEPSAEQKEVLRAVTARKRKDVTIVVDVDPVSLL